MDEPGGARRSQEEPGGARKSQEELGGAKRNQDYSGALRKPTGNNGVRLLAWHILAYFGFPCDFLGSWLVLHVEGRW